MRESIVRKIASVSLKEKRAERESEVSLEGPTGQDDTKLLRRDLVSEANTEQGYRKHEYVAKLERQRLLRCLESGYPKENRLTKLSRSESQASGAERRSSASRP